MTQDELSFGLFDSQADAPSSLETLDDVRSEPRDGAYQRQSYTGDEIPDRVKFILVDSHGPVDSVFVARRNAILDTFPLSRRHMTGSFEDITVILEGTDYADEILAEIAENSNHAN